MSKQEISLNKNLIGYYNEPLDSNLIGQYYKTSDPSYALLKSELDAPYFNYFKDYIEFQNPLLKKHDSLKNAFPQLCMSNTKTILIVYRQHQYTLSSMLKKITQNKSVQSYFLELLSTLKLVVASYILFFETEKVFPSHNCLEDTNILFLNEQGQYAVIFRDMWQSSNLLKFYLDKHEQRKREAEQANNPIFIGEIAPELKESIKNDNPKGSPQADMFSFGVLLRQLLSGICWSILSNEQKQSFDVIITLMTDKDASKRISWSNLENQFNEMIQIQLHPSPPQPQQVIEPQQIQPPNYQYLQEPQRQQQIPQQPFQAPPNPSISLLRWSQQTNLLDVQERLQDYVLNLEKKKVEITMELQNQNLSQSEIITVFQAEEALQYRNFALALKELFFYMSNDTKFIAYNFNLPQFYFLLTQLIAKSTQLIAKAKDSINEIQLPFIKESPLPSSLQADQDEFTALEQKYLPNLQKDLQTVMGESVEPGDINRLFIERACNTPNFNLTMDKLTMLLLNLSQEVKQQLINQNNQNNSYLKGLSFRLNKLQQGCDNLWNLEQNTYFNFDSFFEKLVKFNAIGW